jgi:hypothetical protein
MIRQGKSNPFLTWAVGVEAGINAFPPILDVAQIVQRLSRILEVARDFPHCQAVGVDLVPMQSM